MPRPAFRLACAWAAYGLGCFGVDPAFVRFQQTAADRAALWSVLALWTGLVTETGG
jgi:hypothetical protein